MQNEIAVGNSRSLRGIDLSQRLAARKIRRTGNGVAEGGLSARYSSIEEDGSGTIHIFPTRDIYEHFTTGIICGCRPAVEWDEMDMIVLHNAFDFREAFEDL